MFIHSSMAEYCSSRSQKAGIFVFEMAGPSYAATTITNIHNLPAGGLLKTIIIAGSPRMLSFAPEDCANSLY